MRIIKLSATPSTNSYLRQLNSSEALEDYTVVVTKKQLSGRGQMGSLWLAESGKNLTASVFKDVSVLSIDQHFFISMVVCLALVKTLGELSIPKLKIKWPNDILSDNQKVCGVLIENILKQNRLKASIIGIGLNVNQTQFDNLPQATSLKCITGATYNLDEILIGLVNNLKLYFGQLESQEFSIIKKDYEALLFRKDKPSTFMDKEGAMFPGYIRSVSHNGKLQVLLEDEEIKEFDLKEIKLLY